MSNPLMEMVVEHTESDRMRCGEILMDIIDPQLRLLKGHLLVEEQLNRLIEFKSVSPKLLEKTRLSFSQKAHLVEALFYHERTFPAWLTKATLQLNKSRNLLAHKLDESELNLELNKLHDMFYSNGVIERTREPTLGMTVFCMGSLVSLYSGLFFINSQLSELPKPFQGLSLESQLTSLQLRAGMYT